MSGRRGVVGLPVAMLLIGVALLVAAGITGSAGVELTIARARLAASEALAAADGCVVEATSTLAAGWDFDDALVGPDGRPGTADDGALPAPPGCTATMAGTSGASTSRLTVTADAGGGRRRVESIVSRRQFAGVPAPLWLESPARVDPTGGVSLGVAAPGATAVAAVVAPVLPGTLDDWLAAHPMIRLGPGVSAPQYAPAPPLATLVARARAIAPPGGSGLQPLAPPPSTALVDGPLQVSTPLEGAGLLIVHGRLVVEAPLRFRGVIAVTDGLEITATGQLDVLGGVWLGDGSTPSRVAGALAITYDPAAVATADALLGLPRLATVASIRDLDD